MKSKTELEPELPILKTSEEWQKIYFDKIVVYDPDGWDRMNFNYSWYEELIDETEFNRRICHSTCQWKIDLNKVLPR
jgi:hypothetical protein